MALINCPECNKQISDKASSCPNCGCPITNAPTTIKIRAATNDRFAIKGIEYRYNGQKIAYAPIDTTVTIKSKNPIVITAVQKYGLNFSGHEADFKAIPGKCYEARYCKTGIFYWGIAISEISYID